VLTDGDHAHGIAQAAGDAEVGHLQFAAKVHHQVRWLEIAVNYQGVAMGVIKRVAELLSPIAQLPALKDLALTVGANVRKRVAVHVFHRDAARSLIVNEVVDAHDIFMGELEAAISFALQVVEQASIEEDEFRQKFQRDLTL